PISFEKWSEMRTRGRVSGTWILTLTFTIGRRPIYTFLFYARRHEFGYANEIEEVEPGMVGVFVTGADEPDTDITSGDTRINTLLCRNFSTFRTSCAYIEIHRSISRTSSRRGFRPTSTQGDGTARRTLLPTLSRSSSQTPFASLGSSSNRVRSEAAVQN